MEIDKLELIGVIERVTKLLMQLEDWTMGELRQLVEEELADLADNRNKLNPLPLTLADCERIEHLLTTRRATGHF